MNYIAMKTSRKKVEECGGKLSDAARGPWVIGKDRYPSVSKYTHAVIFFKGEKDIKAVYKIDKWYFYDYDSAGHSRYVFAGDIDKKLEKRLVGKKGNSNLFKQGRQFPLIYLDDALDLLDF